MTVHAENAELDAALAGFEALYQDSLPWMAKLYDPQSGGFYESVGLKEDKELKRYGPDIQATAQVIILLNSNGLIKNAPQLAKDKLIHYFESRQNPETGYFVDPDYPEMVENQRVLGRALGYSVGALKTLGSDPLYPLPGEPRPNPRQAKATEVKTELSQKSKAAQPSVSKEISPAKQYTPPKNVSDNIYVVPAQDLSGVPPHLVSVEAIRQWMDERPWGHAWTALDNIQSQSTLIRALPEPLRTDIIDEILRYVMERQDADTGLAGGGNIAVRLSGGFKLILFCRAVNRPVPHAEAIQESVFDWLESEPETEKIFFIRNTCDMLNMLVEETGRELTDEQLVAFINFATRELSRYRQDDGAFSSFPDRFFVCPNDLYIGQIPAQAGPQSNINGTSMAFRTRTALYKLADRNRPKLKMDDFWDVCAKESTSDIPVKQANP